MCSMEQKRAANETYTRSDYSSADTITEFGYPSRAMLRTWRKEHERTGKIPEGRGLRLPPSVPGRCRPRHRTAWNTAGVSVFNGLQVGGLGTESFGFRHEKKRV